MAYFAVFLQFAAGLNSENGTGKSSIFNQPAESFSVEAANLAFIGPIYRGMGPVDVPSDAPPMFNAIATDDLLFRGQFGVVKSWYDAGIPVEFHLYQNGGHGFGIGNPDRTTQQVVRLFYLLARGQ